VCSDGDGGGGGVYFSCFSGCLREAHGRETACLFHNGRRVKMQCQGRVLQKE